MPIWFLNLFHIVGDFFFGCDPMAFITSSPIWGICFWSFWKDHQIKQMVSSKIFSSPGSLGKWILFLTNLFFYCRMGTLQVETHHLSVFLLKERPGEPGSNVDALRRSIVEKSNLRMGHASFQGWCLYHWVVSTLLETGFFRCLAVNPRDEFQPDRQWSTCFSVGPILP